MKNWLLLLIAASSLILVSIFISKNNIKEEKKYRIEVLLKATDSVFWQYVESGANQFEVEHKTLVDVSVTAPPSERDLKQQLALLDSIIATRPDAIVFASISSSQSVNLIEKAKKEGIYIVAIDNPVDTDKIDSLIATDQVQAGRLAGEYFSNLLRDREGQKEGTVAIIRSARDAQVVISRDEGFIHVVEKNFPAVEILPAVAIQNDIIMAHRMTRNILNTHKNNLLGIFADNNHSSLGAYLAIKEYDRKDLVFVGFDADPEEITGVREGYIDALVVQRPSRMGYLGCKTALALINKESVNKYQESPVMIVTKENVDQDDLQSILNPSVNR